MKKCNRCKILKQDNEFYSFLSKKGKIPKLRLQSYCIKCNREYSIENRAHIVAAKLKRRTDNPLVKEREWEMAKKRRIANREKYLWFAAKVRAKEFDIDFSIEVSDIIIPDKCPLLKIKLSKEKMEKNDPAAPSLDRIDNEKGYIKGNIWVISYKANAMKNNASITSLKSFCTNLLKELKNWKK